MGMHNLEGTYAATIHVLQRRAAREVRGQHIDHCVRATMAEWPGVVDEGVYKIWMLTGIDVKFAARVREIWRHRYGQEASA